MQLVQLKLYFNSYKTWLFLFYLCLVIFISTKPGDQLMGVTFAEKPSSCDLEQYKALQDRIEELRLELDPDDEDDDGDVPSIVRR